MMKERNLIIQGKTKKPIVADVFYKEDQKPKSVVIFCHGYKGYKDWGAWDLMAEKFAENDLFFIKFNFSHNGGSPENPIDFPDLEAFAEDNYTKQLDDLVCVIQWILNNSEYSDELNHKDLSLIGHSRGGGIVLLKAAENKQVKKVVSLAGVSDFASRFPRGEKLKKWKDEGVYYIENSRTHQKMPHHYQFYTDFVNHRERLDIEKAVQHLNIPQLIIHAKDDTSVHPEEAEKLHKWNRASELYFVQNGAHTFGTKQPWESTKMSTSLLEVVEKTINFLKS